MCYNITVNKKRPLHGGKPVTSPDGKEEEQMKNITREGDANKYYMYKGIFVTRDRHTGYYSAYTASGRIIADTQRGIKKLINEKIAARREE